MLLFDMLMMRALFIFLLKLNSYHSHKFTSPLQQTLKQSHSALRNCYSVKIMMKFLAFKWLLKELLLEAKWYRYHVNLVICLNSIHQIFFKILFFSLFIQAIPLVISNSLENLSLSIYRYHYVSTVLFFFCFFFKVIIFLFFLLSIF